MINEFLPTLYKLATANEHKAMDEVWDVIVKLASERKFDILNDLLVAVDLSKIDTSVEYTMVFLTAKYINQLPYYKEFYQKVREDFARRNRPEKEIKELFDSYYNGGKDLFDPSAPEYKSPNEKDEDKFKEKLLWAKQIGDTDLVNYLNYYKASTLFGKERDDKFRALQRELGDEELRKRTIKSLRDMADLLEETTGSWPGIYYCSLSKGKGRCAKREMIDSVSVTISYPWGG